MTRRRYSTRQLVTRYLTEKRAEGLEERSLRKMQNQLRSFGWQAPDDPQQVRRSTVTRWLDHPEHAPGYRRSRLSVLRGFTAWCVVHGHMRSDPCRSLRLPRVSESVPRRLSSDEVARLMEVASADRRLLLVCLLMLQEGLRRLEVARLNVEDVDFAERTLAIRGKGGQGRYTAVLPISAETWAAFTAYLAAEPHRSGALVRNRVRAHGRMAASSISRLVRDALVEAGVSAPGDLSRARTPHSLRHTCASDILERTGNLRLVQAALRHASVRSTEIYVRGVVGGDLREAMAGRKYG